MPGAIIDESAWWKEGVVYQIYPASYKDSNDDGIGDLEGIMEKLDYIKSIGVDIVWVCPHFESPQVDMGYDVSDYQAIHRPYGTVKDCERLIEECHKRDMKIIFDLVVNHTSNEHQWFKASRSSRKSPKRDWYIWRPAKHDAQGKRLPPNNWRSNFSTSAWSWDEATQAYYLHLFAPEQPDLNWDNADVRKTIWEDVVEFWLKKGVNGFRVDTVNMYSKGDMKDAPVSEPGEETQWAGFNYCNGPRMREFLREMNAVMAKYNAMTVGECPNTPDMEKVKQYVSAAEKQLNMVFQFDAVDVGREPFDDPNAEIGFRLRDFKAAITRTQQIMTSSDAWATAFLENHDQGRSISRFCSDAPEFREASAKMLALMLATLSGTLFLYQGQEIGMANIPMSWPVEEYKDVSSQNWYNAVRRSKNGDPRSSEAAKAVLQYLARDHSRVPMQWDSSANAGFSNATPWMRVNDDYTRVNVAAQEQDSESVLAFWKSMVQLRKLHANLFIHGEFNIVDAGNSKTFTYTKMCKGKKAVVVLNFTKEQQPNPALEEHSSAKSIIGSKGIVSQRDLSPFEGRVYLF